MRRALLLFVFTGLLVLSSFGAVGKASGASPQAEDSCLSGQLKTARVTTSVRLKHDGEDYTKAETDLVVQVPKTWKLARNLLLNGDTERYRSAMRCVLRYPDDPYPYRDTHGLGPTGLLRGAGGGPGGCLATVEGQRPDGPDRTAGSHGHAGRAVDGGLTVRSGPVARSPKGRHRVCGTGPSTGSCGNRRPVTPCSAGCWSQ